MTRREAFCKVAQVRSVLDDAIARAIDEDRDFDYDRLVHALESFDDLATELIRRMIKE